MSITLLSRLEWEQADQALDFQIARLPTDDDSVSRYKELQVKISRGEDARLTTEEVLSLWQVVRAANGTHGLGADTLQQKLDKIISEGPLSAALHQFYRQP